MLDVAAYLLRPTAISGLRSYMAPSARAKSLYRAVCRLSPKAEKLDRGTVTEAFVDAGHVQRLSNSTAQFIEGRRGTGKTHLLMYLNDLVNAQLHNKREASVYLDIRDLRIESGTEDRSPATTARRIFRELLASVASQLRDIDSQILGHNDIHVERHPYDQRMARRSREALIALNDALNGHPVQTARTRTEQQSKATTAEEYSGFEIAVTRKDILGGSGTASTSTKSKEASETTDNVTSTYRLSFATVRVAIEAFLERRTVRYSLKLRGLGQAAAAALDHLEVQHRGVAAQVEEILA